MPRDALPLGLQMIIICPAYSFNISSPQIFERDYLLIIHLAVFRTRSHVHKQIANLNFLDANDGEDYKKMALSH